MLVSEEVPGFHGEAVKAVAGRASVAGGGEVAGVTGGKTSEAGGAWVVTPASTVDRVVIAFGVGWYSCVRPYVGALVANAS